MLLFKKMENGEEKEARALNDTILAAREIMQSKLSLKGSEIRSTL